jgi:uncharacterized protein involved in exopolysaccharide biosynthesis
MDQEIDLRLYIAILLKHKYWIIGLALFAAVTAAIISLALSPTYEASALVAITKPQYELQFDPRIRSLSGNVQPPYRAYPLLATSDEIVVALIADLGDRLEGQERTIQGFAGKLEAENTSDQSLVRLSVQDGDPQRAALIANHWAENFVQAANELYAQSSDELGFFTEQQTEAERELAQAEQALIDLQAQNRVAILGTQLAHARKALTTDLETIYTLETTIQNARTLRRHLSTQEGTAAASPGDELAAILIEIGALNHGNPGMQVQLSAVQDLGGTTVGDQIDALDSLIAALEDRLVALQEQALAHEPEILSLQQRHQEAQTELDRLTRDQTLARDTFTSLSRKADEAKIAARATTGDVRLASRATPLDRPVSPRKTLNTLAAGVCGLLIGCVAALAIEYWRQGQQAAPSS